VKKVMTTTVAFFKCFVTKKVMITSCRLKFYFFYNLFFFFFKFIFFCRFVMKNC
jgi:hypothetical protein